MVDLIQSSFAKGEISPELYGRVDTAAYQVALRRARNCIIHPQGGVSNRPGTIFIGAVKDHTAKPRLIEFQFKTTDTYILEFGNQYIRVIRNDAHVLNAAEAISAVTQADPAVVTVTSHTFSNGDEVFIDGIVGMTELNNRTFIVANKTTHTFGIVDQVTGVDIDSSAFTAYSSAGTAASVFTLTTPYVTADLFDIKFTQNADVMTLTHPDYDIRELTRTDHNAWTLVVPTFAPDIANPTAITVTVNTTGAVIDRYKVTAIADETSEESLPGLSNVTTASASATAANPVVVTAAGHPYANGDEVEINGYNEMTEVNNRQFIVAGALTNTFELEGEDGSGYAAETTGGSVNATHVEITNGAVTRDNTIAFTGVAGAKRHAVYRRDNGLYGFLGETELATFLDSNITPDLDLSPPKARNPFLGTDNAPGTVSYHQQRRVFGGSNSSPDTSWYTQTGHTSNLTVHTPTRADDAITARMNSLQVNEIRHFVPGEDLIVLTSGGEWRVNSGSSDFFSASTIKQKPQTSDGSSHIRPLVIGKTILFVPDNKASVRSLGFSFQVDGYTGVDISKLASHMLEEEAVLVDWAYGQAPDPTVYAVRSDGVLLVLVFDAEQEVVAWTTWDTDGDYESVATTLPSSAEIDEAAYFVVKRTVGGNTVRYIERTASRRFTDVQDCFFVDCGLTLDDPTDISGATATDPVVVTATAHPFVNGDEVDIADIVWVPTFDDDFNETQPSQLNGRRYIVTAKAANTFTLLDTDEALKNVEGATQADPVVISSTDHGYLNGDVISILDVVGMTELNGIVYKVANVTTDTFELTDEADVDINGTGFTAWSSAGSIRHAIDGSAFDAYVSDGEVRETAGTLSGLRHLAGEEVVALADGNVLEDLTVSATGTVTLARNASRVHIGLRYITDIQTLDIENFEGATIQGKKVNIKTATLRFKKTRGLLYGPNSDKLQEMKQREFENMGEPTRLLTGDKEITMTPEWNKVGRVLLRQKDPLPVTILAIVPDLVTGT